MPAPYPLIEMPPGSDVNNIFDRQAMDMACAHNTFIQGINAMIYHASRIREDQVRDFMMFCITLVQAVHEHHLIEEQFTFPEFEKKLGEGALQHNVDQHAGFLPQFHGLEEYIQAVKDGKKRYNGNEFVEMINSFSDIFVQHLVDEIPTIETTNLQKHFTEKEMKDFDVEFMRRAIERTTLNAIVPFFLVCANPATPWFPPMPAPLLWAVRVWFSRKYAAAWKFGPCDIHKKLKEHID